MQQRILIIGANGQIGTELVIALGKWIGEENVIATDISAPNPIFNGSGKFLKLDVLDKDALHKVVDAEGITTVYNMAALLSATAEKKPMKAWELNITGLLNVLNVCVDLKVQKVFWPSSIAVFGPDVPKENTPQDAALNPTTIYGVSKVAGEQLCAWYHRTHGLDVRSIRYPGLISYKTQPGGGTTDYSVEIFHAALNQTNYICPLKADAALPFMYMSDAIRGTIDLMNADASQITVRNSYNFTAFSLSPGMLAQEIAKHIPELQVTYRPDYRQQFAESWPMSIDDSAARQDWQWNPEFDIAALVQDMLAHLRMQPSAA